MPAEDQSAVECPIYASLKYYTWPERSYVVEICVACNQLAVQHVPNKKQAVNVYNTLRRREDLWKPKEKVLHA